MVVVTIVSVLSVGAILAIGGGGRLLPGAQPGDLAEQENRLARALALGRDTALFGRREAGLQPLESGWQVTTYDPTAARWTPILSETVPGMSLGWTVAGQVYPAPGAARDRAPPVRILADGRLTAFSLRLRVERQSLTCRATGVSDLRCGAP